MEALVESGSKAMDYNMPIMGKWDFVFLLGESGGGKGTLVANIKKHLFPDIPSASMGEIFREKAQSDPEIKRLVSEGSLISDSLVFSIFKDFAKANHGGIIDGFPRNRSQVLDSIKLMKRLGWRVLIIDIDCRLETIIERLLARGRDDDKLDIMFKRNQARKTLHPVVMEEIKSRHDVFDIVKLDGNKPAHWVFSDFLISLVRHVDPLNLYGMPALMPDFHLGSDETTTDFAINRMLCQLVLDIQSNINSTMNIDT